ncbi:MAG: NFACT family protein, partial [Eubacteriales bacterium]|nr:NFACT family protein [Eubacteriales bacterium]
REIALHEDRRAFIDQILSSIENESYSSVVYRDKDGMPREYSIFPLKEYEESCTSLSFPTLSSAMEFFYENRTESSRAKQHSHDLIHSVKRRLEKLYLKKQKLSEELLKAENSENLRLYGELLTANLHNVPQGAKEITVISYYDEKPVTIPLDPRYTPNKNAQRYFKQYGKSKTAVKEKQIQLEENQQAIDYLESVLTYLNNTSDIRDIEDLRQELIETGYLRDRKKQKQPRAKKYRPSPMRFYTSDGFLMLIGRNNKENDALTLHIASKNDYWLHTKDIPGSHVILETNGKELTETAVYEAASAAAYFSKGRAGENIPVDYVRVRYVKKPSGAKPGMVIFTNNRTVYVNPKKPARTKLEE